MVRKWAIWAALLSAFQGRKIHQSPSTVICQNVGAQSGVAYSRRHQGRNAHSQVVSPRRLFLRTKCRVTVSRYWIDT